MAQADISGGSGALLGWIVGWRKLRLQPVVGAEEEGDSAQAASGSEGAADGHTKITSPVDLITVGFIQKPP